MVLGRNYNPAPAPSEGSNWNQTWAAEGLCILGLVAPAIGAGPTPAETQASGREATPSPQIWPSRLFSCGHTRTAGKEGDHARLW